MATIRAERITGRTTIIETCRKPGRSYVSDQNGIPTLEFNGLIKRLGFGRLDSITLR